MDGKTMFLFNSRRMEFSQDSMLKHEYEHTQYLLRIHNWLKKHCWSNHSPEGQCINTAFFIEEITGWRAVMGSYHAWVFAPNGKVLDMTVEQYGFNHFTRLVDPRTIFDILPDGAKKYCDEEIRPLRKTNYSRTLSYVWVKKFIKEIR